jgi:RNA polymerase sigma-70 factor (ECF subfamily)
LNSPVAVWRDKLARKMLVPAIDASSGARLMALAWRDAYIHRWRHYMAEKKNYISELYKKHYEELRRFVAGRLSGGEAADVVQDVFVRTLCLEPGYDIREPRAFLFRVASNIVLDRLRMQQHRHESRGTVMGVRHDEPADEISPETTLDAQQRLGILREAIGELPPRCREVFLLHKFHHRSHAQIARQCGISVNMVEKHIIKALAHCRKRLAGLE